MYHSCLYHYKATKATEAARMVNWPSIQDCDYLVSKSSDAQLQTASQPSKTGLFDTFHNKTTNPCSNSLTVSPSLITVMIFFLLVFLLLSISVCILSRLCLFVCLVLLIDWPPILLLYKGFSTGHPLRQELSLNFSFWHLKCCRFGKSPPSPFTQRKIWTFYWKTKKYPVFGNKGISHVSNLQAIL